MVSKKGGFGFTSDALRGLLVNNTTDISSFNRNYYLGSGLVNAYKSIAGTGGVAPEKVTSFNVEKPFSNVVNFSATVPADEDDGKPNTIIVYYSESPIVKTDGLRFSAIYVNDTKVGKEISGKITGLKFKTIYYFVAVASDLAGNKSVMSDAKTIITGDNHAPIIESSSPDNFTLKSYQIGYYDFTFSDPDDHVTVIELNKGSEAETLDTLIMTSPKIKIEAMKAAPGNYKSTITVTDNYGLFSTKDIHYTILDNIAPKIVDKIDDQIFNSKSADLKLNEKDYFIDEDEEPLNYKITNSDESVVNVNYSKGIFYFTTLGYGYSDITITASDALGASVSQSFKVLVRDGNELVDIYPNPMMDYLYVRTSEEASASLKLTNSMGSTVYENKLAISPFKPAKVDVTGLAADIYTVILDYNGTKATKTVVKL